MSAGAQWQDYAPPAPTGAGDGWEDYAPKKQAPASATAAPKPEPNEPPTFLNTLGREVKSLGGSVAGVVPAVWNAFTDKPTSEETDHYGKDQVSGAKRIGLGIGRLTTEPIRHAADWYKDAFAGKIPHAYEDALSVAPEAIGAGAAAPVSAKIIQKMPAMAKSVAANAPKIAQTAVAVGKPAVGMGLEAAADVPVVRGLVKGAKAFKDVPGKLADIWQKEPAAPPVSNRVPLWKQAGTTAGHPEPNIETTNVPEPTPRARVAAPPVQASPVQTVSEPAAPPVKAPRVGELAKMAVRGAGGNPDTAVVTPGKPIAARPSTEVPKGIPQETPPMAPVESSALKGYHYDPASQVMTVETKSGGMYRYGEVTAEEAAAFEKAPSKGKAYQGIRDNHVQVGKRISDGKWVVGQPKAVTATPESEAGTITRLSRPLRPGVAAPDEDLTGVLKRSIADVKAKKRPQ